MNKLMATLVLASASLVAVSSFASITLVNASSVPVDIKTQSLYGEVHLPAGSVPEVVSGSLTTGGMISVSGYVCTANTDVKNVVVVTAPGAVYGMNCVKN